MSDWWAGEKVCVNQYPASDGAETQRKSRTDEETARTVLSPLYRHAAWYENARRAASVTESEGKLVKSSWLTLSGVSSSGRPLRSARLDQPRAPSRTTRVLRDPLFSVFKCHPVRTAEATWSRARTAVRLRSRAAAVRQTAGRRQVAVRVNPLLAHLLRRAEAGPESGSALRVRPRTFRAVILPSPRWTGFRKKGGKSSVRFWKPRRSPPAVSEQR